MSATRGMAGRAALPSCAHRTSKRQSAQRTSKRGLLFNLGSRFQGGESFRLCVISPDSQGVEAKQKDSSANHLPSMDTLPFKSIISVEGEVHPEEREGIEASVFAVFDQAKQLQFIGFSKHLKNSLRTILGRQSDYCYYYKHVDYPYMNQEEMVSLRDLWIEENHGMPEGLKPGKRQLWQQPAVAGGVSERGKLIAAKQMLETTLKKLDQRGLKEEMLPDEELLKEGKVDFLPAKELTEEEKRLKHEHRMKILEATRECTTVVDGNQETFMLFYESIFEANGGAMLDVTVTKDDVATSHRIIIGEDYITALSMPVKDIAERTISFLLSKKVKRKTEGMLMSNEFPVNYFALSSVEQWYDDFALAFTSREEEEGGNKQLPGEDKFWRFNRIHNYGWTADERYQKNQKSQNELDL